MPLCEKNKEHRLIKVQLNSPSLHELLPLHTRCIFKWGTWARSKNNASRCVQQQLTTVLKGKCDYANIFLSEVVTSDNSISTRIGGKREREVMELATVWILLSVKAEGRANSRGWYTLHDGRLTTVPISRFNIKSYTIFIYLAYPTHSWCNRNQEKS